MGKIFLELDVMMAKRHISLNELAQQVGITNVNMSKIKNNKVNAVRFSTLAGICKALDCEPGDILKYDETAEEDSV
ncbi:MAG: helix-turn-helix transcriptional regulator [Pseudobutyrivibrio sp.]|nr:helix-turn-helix transcriptional regulator [Pseudobutyrivibrio sp.]